MNYNTILPPFKWFVLQNFPYIEDDFDALTNWQLFCKLGKEMNKIIEKCNLTGEQVENLTNAFNSLQNYVNNYFENLDVQENVDAKLDEMAESGQLTDIIAQYLQLAGVLAYDTKTAMKSATNLVDGSITKTLGNTSYQDGQGAFYKVREVQNTDVIDDENIIALSDPDLVAEKIPYSSGYDIQTNLQPQIDSNYNLINQMKERLNQKLTICKDTYYPVNDIKGSNFGLSFERISNFPTPFSIQGVCYNNVDGKVYGNDGSRIFTITEGNPTTITTLYTIDLGHGGDCCIHDGYMYIIDSEYSNIHKVKLSDGTDTVMNIPSALITNETTTGTPKAGGICINEKEEILIGVIDEGSSNQSIPDNATIRIYKYTSSSNITKLCEIDCTSVYLQGFTTDNDNYYIIGNKPLISSDYGGNNLYVINKFTNTLIDTMENTQNYEHEGLDYCSIAGCEGLMTTVGASNFGIYAYYGNTTRTFVIESNNPNMKKIITISRGGQINVRVQIEDTFSTNQTYTFSNFLPLNPAKMGGVVELLFYGSGESRSKICQAVYNCGNNELKIFPTSDMTKFNGNFTFCGF